MGEINFLGLDLSLTSTGYCFKGNYGTITTPTRGAERLSVISNKIIDIIMDNPIDIVVIESYSFASRNSQAHSIGELGGAVRMRLFECGVFYIDVPPTCRAKFATGKGNASKNEVISSISARTGIVWTGSGADDMCDAWILEQMGLAYVGKSTYDWPEINMSSLKSVDWENLEKVMKFP